MPAKPPPSIRGLAPVAREHERTAIRAAIQRDGALAQLAMMEYPNIGHRELGGKVRAALAAGDPEHLGDLC